MPWQSGWLLGEEARRRASSWRRRHRLPSRPDPGWNPQADWVTFGRAPPGQARSWHRDDAPTRTCMADRNGLGAGRVPTIRREAESPGARARREPGQPDFRLTQASCETFAGDSSPAGMHTSRRCPALGCRTGGGQRPTGFRLGPADRYGSSRPGHRGDGGCDGDRGSLGPQDIAPCGRSDVVARGGAPHRCPVGIALAASVLAGIALFSPAFSAGLRKLPAAVGLPARAVVLPLILIGLPFPLGVAAGARYHRGLSLSG